MRKMPLFLTSLVSAIPGVLLVYMFVIFLLNHWGQASGGVQGISVLAGLTGVALVGLPIYILVGYVDPLAPQSRKSESAAEAVAESDDTFETQPYETPEEDGDTQDTFADSGEVSELDSGDVVSVDSDEISEADSEEMLAADSDEFADFEEEEPAPKKKKK